MAYRSEIVFLGMHRKNTLCLWYSLLLFPVCTFAQSWTLPASAFYVNVSHSLLTYDRAFDATGEFRDLPVTVSDRTVQLMAQYGVTDRLTAEVRLPYKMLETSGDPAVFNSYPGQYIELGSLSAPGNAEAGVIYKFYDDKPILTASLFVEALTSQHNYIQGLQTGFNSWAVRPGIGAGWTHGPSWMQFYLGTSLRTNDYSHAAISNLEIGYKPADYLYAALAFDVRQSFGNGGDCDCTTDVTALYMSEQEYLGIALKGGFEVGALGFNFAYHAAMAANNAAAVGVPVFGIQYRSN